MPVMQRSALVRSRFVRLVLLQSSRRACMSHAMTRRELATRPIAANTVSPAPHTSRTSVALAGKYQVAPSRSAQTIPWRPIVTTTWQSCSSARRLAKASGRTSWFANGLRCFCPVCLDQRDLAVVGPVSASRGIDQDWHIRVASAAPESSQQARRTDAFAVVGNEHHVAKRNCGQESRRVVTDGSRYFTITAVWSQLSASDDSLLPRCWTIINPQVRFNTVGVDQAS